MIQLVVFCFVSDLIKLAARHFMFSHDSCIHDGITSQLINFRKMRIQFYFYLHNFGDNIQMNAVATITFLMYLTWLSSLDLQTRVASSSCDLKVKVKRIS